ncbi:MAG: hypothetical protein LBN30_04125 [Oscillospiraceae bacterium]|jgi:hypothetical protein|nr:hypothetical protein [Oscillospiraceae bacterium]
MTEERRIILEMLKNGEVTVDDAAQLLDAVGETGDNAADSAPTYKGAKPKRLVIQQFVGEERKINMRLPFALVKLGLKLGAKFSAGKTLTIDGVEASIMEDIDLKQLISELDNGEIALPHTIMDVKDDAESVLIVIE